MVQLQPPDFRLELGNLQLFGLQHSILGENRRIFGCDIRLEVGELLFRHPRLIMRLHQHFHH
jgi:hypothetical protein